MNFARTAALLSALFVSSNAQAQVSQIVGKPGGNALLYFVKSGSQGREGSAPSLSSWRAYSNVVCPADISLWVPLKSGEFCAANKAALSFGPALASLCDAQYSLQCRLLSGKYTSKGVTTEPGINATFWYFDGAAKYPVEVSAKSERRPASTPETTSVVCPTVGRKGMPPTRPTGSSEGMRGLMVVANGEHMCGIGGRGDSISCVETSDRFHYSDPAEVPDLDGHPFAWGTMVAYVGSSTIYRLCAGER